MGSWLTRCGVPRRPPGLTPAARRRTVELRVEGRRDALAQLVGEEDEVANVRRPLELRPLERGRDRRPRERAERIRRDERLRAVFLVPGPGPPPGPGRRLRPGGPPGVVACQPPREPA